MPSSCPFCLAFALLGGCYYVPASLAELGPTGATVKAENYGYGANVGLSPEEGCPTVFADATLNGAALVPSSEGRSVATGPVYALTTVCESPSYYLDGYVEPSIDGLTFTLSDDTDTWTAADALRFDWVVVDERALYPEEATVYVELDREVDVREISVWGGTEMEGGTATIKADADGGFAVVLNPRWHGETTLNIEVMGTYEADRCEGFETCTMTTIATGAVVVQVR